MLNRSYRVLLWCLLFTALWAAAQLKLEHGKMIPAYAVLITIFFSKSASLGLLAGALSGCLFLTQGNGALAIRSLITDHFFPAMQGPWRVGAILFTLILGSFTVVIERSGGFESVAKRLIEKKGGNRQQRLETATGLMGLLCFFDGLANSLLLGKITQPLADRAGVARARMAYLVDSTSSSMACIAFISTWIATQLSLIEQAVDGRGIETSAYLLFFQSIPLNFYCLFTLALVVVVIWRQWNFGPMRKAQPNIPEKKQEERRDTPSLYVALVPIISLSVAIVLVFYVWETSPLFPLTANKLAAAFSGNAGPYALTLGSIIGLIIACLTFPRSQKHRVPAAIREGAANMLSPLLILIMAWTFGSVMKDLGTAAWLANTMSSQFSPQYYPAAVFLTGASISFLTGSSWGAMALLMPLAIPSYLDISGDHPILLAAVIGAVFSGAVFGDHCSPFSDTTIVSAFACGVTPQEHVITQLPYALLAALITLAIGYMGIAQGCPAWLCLLSGIGLLAGLGCILTRKKT